MTGRFLLRVLALGWCVTAAGASFAKEDLPAGTEQVLAMLRADPTDPNRLERVVEWSNEHGGPLRLAESILAPQRPPLDATDLFIAGRLLDAGGRGDLALDALARARTLDRHSPAAHALIDLWTRAGRFDRALEIAEDLPTLPLDIVLPLLVRSADRGRERAAERLRAARLSDEERLRLARTSGLHEFAADLALELGDRTGACEEWLRAGRPDRALALLDLGAVPTPRTRLALARWSGVSSLLPAEAPETLHHELERSLGLSSEDSTRPTGRTISADAPALPPPRRSSEPSLEADARRLRTRVAPDGRPSLDLALAWLERGEIERAHDEVARWRLVPRAGEETRRRSLEARFPAWWGLPEPVHPLLVELRRTTAESANPELGRRLDAALLRADAGSDAEAALLFQRSRVPSWSPEAALAATAVTRGRSRTPDLDRARAIAPSLHVARPILADPHEATDPGSAATMLLVVESIERVANRGESEILPLRSVPFDPPKSDRVIGGVISQKGAAETLRVASHLDPALANLPLAITRWEPIGEAPPLELPVGLDASALARHPLAPLRGWIAFPDGTWVIGSGLAWHDRHGFTVRAIEFAHDRDRRPLDPRDLPLDTVALLDPLFVPWAEAIARSTAIDLDSFPAIEAAWRGIVAREERPAERTALSIHGFVDEGASGAVGHVIIRGGGVRLLLGPPRKTERTTPSGPFEEATLGAEFGRLRVWRRSDPSVRPFAPSPPDPERAFAAAEVTTTRSVHPTSEEAPLIDPWDEDHAAPTLTPAGHPFAFRRVFATWTFSVSRDGWCCASDEDRVLWWAFLEPPLPGPEGWRERRPSGAERGRRGPDRTGPTGSGGTLAVRRLDANRAALLSDLSIAFDRSGPIAAATAPAGPHGARAILDVALVEDRGSAPRLALLPAPGDAIHVDDRRIGLPTAGGFDLEVIGGTFEVLAYDPVAVALVRRQIDRSSGNARSGPLPGQLPVEEDRADQRPVALAVHAGQLVVAGFGTVWIETNTGWRRLLSSTANANARPTTAWLPAHAWQSAPVFRGSSGAVAWPWGVIVEFSLP